MIDLKYDLVSDVTHLATREPIPPVGKSPESKSVTPAKAGVQVFRG